MKNCYKLAAFVFLLVTKLCAGPLSKPIESYYTLDKYRCPHFQIEALYLDQNSFINLINEVHEKTHDRAFLIEVPNELYSQNVDKLHCAEFFHYCDYPEKNASIWCKTNGSGIPLVASHTFGAKAVVYYKKEGEYFFLLIMDKYGSNGYSFPGGYVQPDDSTIAQAFEKRLYCSSNLNYRSPFETAMSEVFEETHFDLQKYGYSLKEGKKPKFIGQIYTKNTRPTLGIHSVNDCCQYLLFEVIPNNDPLQKQEHEISDARWVNYSDIINNNILGPLGIQSVKDNVKALVQRVVAMNSYKETRNQLSDINKNIESLIRSEKPNSTLLSREVQKQLDLYKQIRALEQKLKQATSYSENVHTTYFVPL